MTVRIEKLTLRIYALYAYGFKLIDCDIDGPTKKRALVCARTKAALCMPAFSRDANMKSNARPFILF